ncbi:MAG: histidine kinase [Bacteroidota bacterium]
MIRFIYVLFVFITASFTLQGQGLSSNEMAIKGTVREQQTLRPISGVEVTTDKGQFTITNALGEFTVKASRGDIIVFRSPDFETVRHTIQSDDDIAVEVQDYSPGGQSKRGFDMAKEHQKYLDSAEYYKQRDIEKSIDFISKSLALLGKQQHKTQLSKSLTLLGEVYLYYEQYDLAITNLKDAQKARKTIKTSLLLAKAYLANRDYETVQQVLTPLLSRKKMVPYQKIQLLELLGDADQGLGYLNKALNRYKSGLQVAEKNQVTPKVIDLNSKIADAYAQADRTIEAEGYYNNSLVLSERLAPQRAIQENEKVADFYNRSNRFQEEIQLRKKSLNQIREIPENAVASQGTVPVSDSITSQRINYKIGNAFVAQSKFDEAIPYLEKSIVEADRENDLVVQKDATRRLSEAYKYKGDFNLAFLNYQAYVALVDSLYLRKEQELSRLSRLNRDITNKQTRIVTLEQERELSQSKYSLALTEQELIGERNKRQKWLIYSLGFGMLLLALTAFLFYRSNKKQQLANDLLALKSLRTQMNPHFIFNALNSVNNYIAKNDERSANRYLSDFSVLMRSVLENSEEDFIPFSKEMELLRLYLKLEHSRFEDKFSYDLKVGEEVTVDDFKIPPMLIQPYVENAIWHGLRYKSEKGYLKVLMQQPDKEHLNITIIDNGIGRKRSKELKTRHQKKQRSKGMGNIEKRIGILNSMYKDKVMVAITDLEEDGTGTKVTLTLKKN